MNTRSYKHPQFNLRLPEEIKQQIAIISNNTGRSMNAEIVKRLENSLSKETPDTELITADQARAISQAGIKEGYTAMLEKCFKEIHHRARMGLEDAYVSSGYHANDVVHGESVDMNIITPVQNKLKELGYAVQFIDGTFYIKFSTP